MPRANVSRVTQTHHATIDALQDPTGIIPDKPLKKNRRPKKSVKIVTSPAVVIARAPVEPWQCDQCPTKGRNWIDMRSHSESTGHHSYSKR